MCNGTEHSENQKLITQFKCEPISVQYFILVWLSNKLCMAISTFYISDISKMEARLTYIALDGIYVIKYIFTTDEVRVQNKLKFYFHGVFYHSLF